MAGTVNVTAENVENAKKLPFRWRRRVRRFLRAEGPEEAAPQAPRKEAAAALHLLTESEPLARLEAQVADLPPALAELLIPAASVAMEAAREQAPIPPARQSALGPVPGSLSDLDASRWRLSWSVFDHPEAVIDDLEHLRLVGRQVRAMAAGYPGLYNLLVSLVASEAANLKAETPSATIPRVRDLQLRTLMGLGLDEKAKQLQAEHGKAEPAKDGAASMPTPPRKSDDAAMTDTQRVADGG